MLRTNIEESYQFKKILNIEGVSSATIRTMSAGRHCIVVTFERKFSKNVDKLPKKINGVPVRTFIKGS